MIKNSFLLLSFTVIIALLCNTIITGIGHVFWPEKASGSKIIVNGEVRGSYLLNQKIYDEKYFMNNGGASGLDPLLPYDLVLAQAPRIAENRAVDEKDLLDLIKGIKRNTAPYTMHGNFININQLNIILDDTFPTD